MALEPFTEPLHRCNCRAARGWFLADSPILAAASVCLALVVASAILAPWLSPHDPVQLAPSLRLKPPSAEFPLGTDAYGRDLLSRILYGGRISLLIGIGAAFISIVIGLAIGLVSGFFKWIDAVVMRIMDGMMAIPGILLAIAVISLSGASLKTVLIAIVIPDIPRVRACSRGRTVGPRGAVRGGRHRDRLQPAEDPVATLDADTFAPLIVQGTYTAPPPS